MDKGKKPEEKTSMRVRKPVQRLEMSAAPVKAKEKLQIPKGKGKPLSEIKTINDNIGKMKTNDEILKGLHRLLYGRAGDHKSIKSNIRQFCGFDYTDKEKEEKEEALEDKLGKWMLSGLKELCQLLNLDVGGTKVVIISRIIDFLRTPSESETKTGKLYNNAVSKVAYEMFVAEKKKELKDVKTDEPQKKEGDEAKDDKTAKKEKDKAMMENIKKMWEKLTPAQQQKYEEEVIANKLVNSKGKVKPKPKAKAKSKVKKVAKKTISKEKSAKKETKEKVKKSLEKAKGTKAKKDVCIRMKNINNYR